MSTPEEALSPEWGEGPWPGVHPSSTDQTKLKRPEWLTSIPSFVHWLVEHVLRAVVQAILGIFIHGPLGSAFPHLQQWALKLEDRFGKISSLFGGLDFLDGTVGDGFHLLQAIHNLIDNLLPAGRLAELFNGRLKDGQEPLSLVDTWDRLTSLLGLGFLNGPFDLVATIHNLIDNLLPAGRLAELFGGRLKDGQEPHALLDTWKHLRDIVLGNDDDPNTPEGDLPGFQLGAKLLQLLAANANDTAQTGLHLFNFPLAQPIFGGTNPTMHSPFGFLHFKKYQVSGTTVTTHADPESVAATQTASAGIFNRFDKSLDVTLATFRAKATGTISAMKLHLWRMDTTSGDITFIQSETLNPAALPTALFDNVYMPLTTPIHVDPGTVVGSEATITGSGTLAIAGTAVPWLTDDLSARPKRPGFSRAVNAGATPPATIADAGVVYSTIIPNIGLGQAISGIPDPKYAFSESFDGSTAAWRALSGGLRFLNGLFQTATSGDNFALFNYSTFGDNVRAEFNLRAAWTILNPSFNAGDKIRLAICCSSTASQYAALEVQSNRSLFSPGATHDLRIVTGTSPTAIPTTRTAVVLAGDYTGLLSIEYDVAANAFKVFVGGSKTPTMTWLDSGHVIAHGPSYRQAAIYANFGESPQPVCDNFSYRDIGPATVTPPPPPPPASINVVDYATPQLAANAAGGKHLVFPAGVTYTVTGLTIPANCYIDGNNSVLKFGDITTTVSSDDALLTVNGSGVTIDNLNFDGNSANQGGQWTEHRHCIKMLGTFSNVTVKNCDMINIISDGVYINTQTGSNIVIGPNNTFATSAVKARNAVSVVTGDTVEVFSNTFNFVSRPDMPGPIDIEPNAPTDHLAHVDVHDNTIIGGSTADTGTLPGIVYGGFVNCPATDIKIRNNNISGTRLTAGVLVIGINGGPFNAATGIVISGNNVHDVFVDGNGAELDYWIGADVINNTFTNVWYGINNYQACLGATTGNTYGAGVGVPITNTTPHCS